MALTLIINEQFSAPIDKEQLSQVADFSFDNFSPNPTPLKPQTLEFRATSTRSDPIEYINNYIATNGIYSNPRVRYADSISGVDLFNGYIDFADSKFFLKDKIYQLELRPDVDSFFETAKGLNLRSLYQNGDIPSNLSFTKDDFNIVKYVKNSVPDTGQAAAVLISLFLAGKIVADALKDLVKDGIDVVNPFTSLNGAAKLAYNIIYYGLLLVSIGVLLKSLSELIFQKIKDYYCIKVKTAIEKGCEYLGYTLNTTIFDGVYKNLNVLPSTGEEGVTRGDPTNNPIPDKTLLQFMEDIALVFNAKLKVESDRSITFETKSFFLKSPIDAKLPSLKKDPSVEINLKENPRTLSIGFRKDEIEKNTYIGIDALDINIGTEPVSSRGDKLTATYTITDEQDVGSSAINEEVDRQFAFSRFFRKNSQNGLEQTFNSIYDVIVRIADLFRKDKQSEGIVGDRIGYGLLDNDFIAVDKIFILDPDGKISRDSFSKVHCESLFDFHRIDTILENQYSKSTGVSETPICDTTTVRLLRDNNVMLDQDGNTITLTKNERDLESGFHTVEYKRKLGFGDFGYIPTDKIVEKIDVE